MQNGEDKSQSGQTVESQLPQIEPVSWSATESIAQQRSKKWYLTVGLIFAVAIIVDVLLFIFKITDLMTLISSLVLFVAMFIALLASTKLQPHESNYVLDGSGLTVNGKLHSFEEFRAFGVRQHGNMWQLVLIPTKRFGMEVVTYIDEEHGERIVDILAGFLPMEEVPENSVDKLIDRLKI